jgi:predicted DCC family thiol-disulfide oxidoreductase YuxK
VTHDPDAPAAVLYDPDCGLCRVCVATILAWDRQGELRPVPLGGEEAAELLPALSPEERMASWHLVSPGGTVWSGGAAFAPLLRLLPGGRPLAALSARLPRGSERAYRLVADNRSTLGRLLPGFTRDWAERRLQGSGHGVSVR